LASSPGDSAGGSLTVVALLTAIVQNLLSNGSTEEFLCRGLFLSALRRWLSNDWSNVIQALLFAPIHAGGTVVEGGATPP
jgi:membrane protease YdiL (CAAX protease family)